MVRIAPFRGIRYDPEKVVVEKQVSPPYDVIKGDRAEMFRARSPFNISRIIKGEKKKTDTLADNEYTRAREYLLEWLEKGILVPEEKSAYYVYSQEFDAESGTHVRWGFIGLLELEELGGSGGGKKEDFTGVLQHEETMPKDIRDRLNLLRATKANFGQIFVIYPDAEGVIDGILEEKMREAPVVDFDDGVGVRHKLWVMTEDGRKSAVTEAMSNRFVIIADGHHRYKTALKYRKENPGLAAAKYRMLTFVNMSNPGLVILPTHRLVQQIDDFDLSVLIDSLKGDFEVTKYGSGQGAREEMFRMLERDFGSGDHGFGICGNDGNYYGLTLRDEEAASSIPKERSEAWKTLDVTILHSLILEKYLGIDEKKLAEGTIEGGSYVEFIKGIGDAVDRAVLRVDRGAQAVFFMNPTRIGEVEEVARNFETMPQKSTFFYPKVYTGFTIYRLE